MAAEVVKALEIVLRAPVDLTVAGRTDRGVHALGQVVSYDGPLPNLRGVNALLPNEIVVLRAEEVSDGFSARHDATQPHATATALLVRRQPSAFERGRALWWPHRLDVDALQACAAALPRHARLHRVHAHRRRTTGASRAPSIARPGRATRTILTFEIEAKSFMRNMNRILVGTMLEVAQHKRPLEDFARCSTAPRAATPATPPRPTASTSPRSATKLGSTL